MIAHGEHGAATGSGRGLIRGPHGPHRPHALRGIRARPALGAAPALRFLRGLPVLALVGLVSGGTLSETETSAAEAAAAVSEPAVTAASDATVAEAAGERPFGLPFAEPPGLGTWYVAQSFGNTVYAYFERRSLYGSGQGLHMGLDLAAACGTQVVAIGDGIVRSVDGPGGAPPHNLMLDHANGYVSFYGHLLERPALSVGQRVARGQVIALSGDMYSTCNASPHLHLEVRDASLATAFNPIDLIEADWHAMLLLGGKPQPFQRDLEAPRRWQAFDDQPELRLGGPLLNDYASTWPAAGEP